MTFCYTNVQAAKDEGVGNCLVVGLASVNQPQTVVVICCPFAMRSKTSAIFTIQRDCRFV